MKCKTIPLVLDTNVLVDYYIADRPRSDDSKAFFDFALTHEASCPLFYSPHCVSNLFYLLSNIAKQKIRKDKSVLSEGDAKAAAEFAWGCIDHLQDNATAIGTDQSDVLLACKMRNLHNDLEDNLILAASQRVPSSYLVTNDEKLIKHAMVPAFTPKDMLAFLQTQKC